ncbi:MAG: bifunctional nicotinamidase/pyrazinamidase [Aureliella sp.]
MNSKAHHDKRTALLLVDLQNDFVEGGALAVTGGSDVIAIANQLIPKFELVVATQDWHPANHQSFASQHLDLNIGDTFSLAGLPQTAWPDHCIQGSSGAEFVGTLNQDAICHVVQKGTDPKIDSYSGFYDNGHTHSTGLAAYLHRENATHLVVMGLATDYCVKATVMDALNEGFAVTLVTDGCRGVELASGDVSRALSDMHRAGAVLASSQEI